VALNIQISKDAAKYIQALDAIMRNRIKDKIVELSKDPLNTRTSKPLSEALSVHAGLDRILFLADTTKNLLLISDVGPRGQIYREANS
jgi:mRNA-degrading endonuclease RelE of RelBE toxin-antitoxin system